MKPYTVDIIDEFCQGILQGSKGIYEPTRKGSLSQVTLRLQALSKALVGLDNQSKKCLAMMLNGFKPSENLNQLGFHTLEDCRNSCISVANAIGKNSYLILHQIIDRKIAWSIGMNPNHLTLPDDMCVETIDLPIDKSHSSDLISCFLEFFPTQNSTFERLDKYFKLIFLLFPNFPHFDPGWGRDSGSILHSRWYHPERNQLSYEFYWNEEQKVEGYGGRNFYETISCCPAYASTDWCAWQLLNSIYEGESAQKRYAELAKALGGRTPSIEDIFKSILLKLKIDNNNAENLRRLRFKSVIDLKRWLLGF